MTVNGGTGIATKKKKLNIHRELIKRKNRRRREIVDKKNRIRFLLKIF